LNNNFKTKKGKNVLCEICGKLFYQQPYQLKDKKKFICSRECYLKEHTRKNTIICLNCGKKFQIGKIKNTEIKFCSQKCCYMYRKTDEFRNKMSLIKLEKYRQKGLGSCNDEYCDAWRDQEYKKDLMKDCCENINCKGKTDQLVLHHKNEDKQDCRPENIETLCRSCHALLHNLSEVGRSFL